MKGFPGELVPAHFTGLIASIHATVINIDAGGYFVSLLSSPRDRTALSVFLPEEDARQLWEPGTSSGLVRPGATVRGFPTHLDIDIDNMEAGNAVRIVYDTSTPRFSGRLAGRAGGRLPSRGASHGPAGGQTRSSAAPLDSARLYERCARVLSRLEAEPGDHRGFVPLLLTGSGPGGESPGGGAPGGGASDPFVERARQILRSAAGGSAPLLDLSPLVGLGPGFTPAGDDFVAGAILAEEILTARSLAHEHPDRGGPSAHVHAHPHPPQIDREAIRSALPRTTTGGATLLRLALARRPPLVAHRIYAIMHRPDPEETVIRAARRYGHSSGLDTLTGFLWRVMFDRARYGV